MGAILKISRQIENPTSSIDGNLLEKNPVKFQPDPIWIQRSLKLFDKPKKNNNKNKKKKNNMSIQFQIVGLFHNN